MELGLALVFRHLSRKTVYTFTLLLTGAHTKEESISTKKKKKEALSDYLKWGDTATLWYDVTGHVQTTVYMHMYM